MVNNFVKYKIKNQQGDIKKHPADCMCVDHLIKARAVSTFGMNNLLEKIKQKQKNQGAVKKMLNTKPNTKIPVAQGLTTTKVNRNNVVLNNTPPLE